MIALVFWGPSNCLHVRQREQALPTAITAEALTPDMSPGCAIVYNSRPVTPWTWQRTCAATIHEWGHMTYHAHSHNPNSPMYPVLRASSPAWRKCNDFGWPWLSRRLRRLAALTGT